MHPECVIHNHEMMVRRVNCSNNDAHSINRLLVNMALLLNTKPATYYELSVVTQPIMACCQSTGRRVLSTLKQGKLDFSKVDYACHFYLADGRRHSQNIRGLYTYELQAEVKIENDNPICPFFVTY